MICGWKLVWEKDTGMQSNNFRSAVCLLFLKKYFNFTNNCSHGKGFEEFMCFGDGLHGDCVDRERVIGNICTCLKK